MVKEMGICPIHKREFVLTDGCSECLNDEPAVAPELCTVQAATTAIINIKPDLDTQVQEFYQQALHLKYTANLTTITSVDNLRLATDDLSVIAKIKKALNDKRAEYLKPLEEHKQAIRAAFDTLLEPILEADKIIRDKMLAFNAEQQRIRREQEEINRKRQEAAEAEMRLKGEVTEPVNLVEVVADAPKSITTDMGSTGMRDNWKYEVINFAELDDAYKMTDSAQLTAIARRHHDQKQVPGVRFYNEPTIRVDTR